MATAKPNSLAANILAGRDGERARPSFIDALAAGGGAVVTIGILFLALEASGFEGDVTGEWGALIFLGLLAAGFVGLFFAPAPTHTGWVTIIALAVPGIFGFLILPDADSFGDVRGFIILTILGWVACFVAPRSRGRSIYVAAAALLFYFWILGEVADFDVYTAAPVPSPAYENPGEIVDAIGGGERPAVAVAFGAQDLEDLDESDPLYPLAEDCAAGDDEACDDLWSSSEVGSDFEDFADSCGGRGGSYPCTSDAGDSGDNLDEELDEDFNGLDEDIGSPTDDFDATPLTPDVNDKAAEIGIVSLLFAAAYLAALRLLDGRKASALGTAFVIPGIVALTQGVGALGEASESAIVGGLLALLAGIGLGLLGSLLRRRFTAWYGGALASVGALVVAGDLSSSEDAFASDPDAVGPGIVITLFGLAVMALAVVVAVFLERRRSQPPRREPPPPEPRPEPPPEPPPEPDSVPI